MQVANVLRMKSGLGETSYAKNSNIQRVIASASKQARQEAATQLYSARLPEKMAIVDMGCSTGPNALLLAAEAIEAVVSTCRELGHRPPEFQVFLNDLPWNDFNSLFRSLPDTYQGLGLAGGAGEGLRCFVSVTPGSFYRRLFPAKSLHYVVSSSSLHWLSEEPAVLQGGSNVVMNKGKIFISKTSPSSVLDAYKQQFQADFCLFLRCRAEEMAEGGRMVLTFMGRRGSDPSADEDCFMWELLAVALMDMASLGLVEEEEVDSFNAPYYAASMEEVRQEITSEGSFTIKTLETFLASGEDEVGDNPSNGGHAVDPRASAERMGRGIRAVVEPMMRSLFGEEIMEELFQRYCSLLEEYFCRNKYELTNILVAVEKKIN